MILFVRGVFDFASPLPDKSHRFICLLYYLLTPQLPKQIVQYHMSKEISPSGGSGTPPGGFEHEGDQQMVDVDLCPSSRLPHLLREKSVDMAEVSAYVSPCSSTDESDKSSSSREDRELRLMARLEGSLVE